MLVVGEKINVLNPMVYKALEQGNLNPIKELAKVQTTAGAEALDVNLGPGRRYGRYLPKVIEAIQEAVDTQLFFTADVIGLAEGLKLHRGRPTINAVTADPDSLPRAMSAANCFEANLVVLLVKPGCLPTTTDEICLVAEEVIEEAEKRDFPIDRLYLDPILRPRIDPIAHDVTCTAMDLGPIVEAIPLIARLRTSRIHTIVGLSNISLGLPRGKRSQLHCSVLKLLKTIGLTAAILNPLDQRLMEAAREKPMPGITLVESLALDKQKQDIPEKSF